jgi:hypothetical protein
MTTLIFNDRGWTVATAAWSAGAKGDHDVRICYAWGADGVSWFDSATGIASVDIHIGIEAFIAALDGRAIIDLRTLTAETKGTDL